MSGCRGVKVLGVRVSDLPVRTGKALLCYEVKKKALFRRALSR